MPNFLKRFIELKRLIPVRLTSRFFAVWRLIDRIVDRIELLVNRLKPERLLITFFPVCRIANYGWDREIKRSISFWLHDRNWNATSFPFIYLFPNSKKSFS